MVLSFRAPDAPVRDRIVRRARRALRALTGSEPSVDVASGAEHLLLDHLVEGDVVDPAGRVSVPLSLGATTLDGRRRTPAEILVDAGDASWPSAMLPPFGACVRRDADSPFLVATDACGLRHVYVLEEPEWAACSTSSLALALTAGVGLDETALATAALAGHQLSDRTPFDGVARLPAGCRGAIRGGAVRRERHSPPAWRGAEPGEVPSTDAAADDLRRHASEGAGVVVRSVATALEAHPDAGLELSGGLDSRMVLAAIPAPLRPGRWALTLASPGRADADIAASLAAAHGLDHEVVDLAALAAMDPGEAAAMVYEAARRHDATADPVATAVLDFVGSRTGGRALLTGQNGEFARGYYYPGQPRWPRVTAPLVGHLARWRVLAASTVDPAVLGPAASAARDEAVSILRRELDGIGGGWPGATDELYLDVRMQNWVGIDFSTSCTERSVLAPYFHPAFLSWARRAPSRWKAGSRLFAAALAHLDPRLASVPLDSGARPVDLARPSWRHRVASAGRFGHKLARKAAQRAAPSRAARAPAGADALAGLVRRAWADDDGALSRLGSLDLVDADVVEAIASGRRAAGPATVGFLVNLDVAVEPTGRAG